MKRTIKTFFKKVWFVIKELWNEYCAEFFAILFIVSIVSFIVACHFNKTCVAIAFLSVVFIFVSAILSAIGFAIMAVYYKVRRVLRRYPNE